MDEMIYNLFLRSRAGVSVFGVLRYELTGFETDSVPDTAGLAPPPWRQLTRQQRPPNIEATVYRARGTVSIPFLTGWQAAAVEGRAFFLPSGQPLVTLLAGPATPISLVFNQANSQQIGGGVEWAPTGTLFGLLGRAVMLPG